MDFGPHSSIVKSVFACHIYSFEMEIFHTFLHSECIQNAIYSHRFTFANSFRDYDDKNDAAVLGVSGPLRF